MKKYLCIVSYDGSCFHGWQIQPNQPTIQQTIQKALSRMHKKEVHIVGAGRTDANVHALGQTFHFESDLNLTGDVYKRALNALLPDSIEIKSIKEVDQSFHARFDAKQKHYQYRINMGDYDLFQRNFVYQLNQPLKIDLMKKASHLFIGEHDFTSFNATPIHECENQVRHIYSITFTQEKHLLKIDFVGNGFLRYMVRMLVQTLIQVGLEKITVNEMQQLLLAKDKQAHGYLAPACGLMLVEVVY